MDEAESPSTEAVTVQPGFSTETNQAQCAHPGLQLHFLGLGDTLLCVGPGVRELSFLARASQQKPSVCKGCSFAWGIC